MNLPLFPKDDFKIVRLDRADVEGRSDLLQAFENLVLSSESMYPDIRLWLSNKVRPDIGSPARAAFVAYEGERPAASAVLKLGAYAKICHLHVRSAWRNQHLGEVFFTLMALHARREARAMHFTLPASLWDEKRAFFEGFGFAGAERSETQYRAGDVELACEAPIRSIVAHAEAKLPKLSEFFTISGRALAARLLMSVRPVFARALIEGRKRIEVRRRFSKKWEGARVALYATQPDGMLLGEVTIRRVTLAPPQRLWKEFGAYMGCTRTEFDAYVRGVSSAAAIEVEHPRPYLAPISLAEIEHWGCTAPRPPQSFVVIEPEDDWGRALALASLLHAGFARREARQAVLAIPS